MDKVGIHCYGCPAVVAVDSRSPEAGLHAAGWSLVHGETYCPECARAKGPAAQPAQMRAPGPGLNANAEAAPPGVSVLAPESMDSTNSMNSTRPSRELALLDTLEVRLKRAVGLGVLATVLGLLLFAGLSTSPIAVVAAAVTVIGMPLSQLWDDRTQRRTKQAIAIFLAVMAFWLVVKPLADGWGAADFATILRWVLLLGPVFIWGGLRSLRYLPLARRSLSEPTYDIRLEIEILRGYGGIPYTRARLWPSDTAMLPAEGQVAHPLAQFSWQASEPQLAPLGGVPAKVRGAPTNGAVVVVSCPQAVVVGRVKRSHFGEALSPPKPMSPLMAWLWKPRSLRLR